MSNYKSTLQTNNEALSSNNLDLQSLIDQANALPDAGGSAEWICCNELPSTYISIDSGGDSSNKITVYLELTDSMKFVLFDIGNAGIVLISKASVDNTWMTKLSDLDLTVEFVNDIDGYFCKLTFSINQMVYALPIHNRIE